MSKYILSRKAHTCKMCHKEIPIATLCVTVMTNTLKFYHDECFKETQYAGTIINPEFKEKVMRHGTVIRKK